MKIFDSHAHYDDEKFNEDRDFVLDEVRKQGVEKIISAGYSLESSLNSLKLSEKYEFIYSTVGISPNDIPENEQMLDEQLKKLEKILEENKNNPKLVAIGEIGLDYYWNKENKNLQIKAFESQIQLANKYNLPIVIHTREAVEDTLKILTQNELKNNCVMHCCPLNLYLVGECLKQGFYISFAGPVTFKNSKNAEEIIKMVPIEKLFVETDSPYLSPEPKRGTRNDSRNLVFIIEKICNVKQMKKEDLLQQIWKNANDVFKI